VLATFVLSSRLGKAETIFNAVFFVVLVSTLFQGTTLEWLATRLGLVDPRPALAAAPLEVDALGSLELVEFDVAGDHAISGAAVSELGLPRSALVAVVARHGETIPPRGATVVEPGDRLFVLAPRALRPELEDVFSRWRRRV
jgi:cell volume regulation protein A